MESQNNSFVEYPNWPEWVKILTALYWKPGLVLAKNPSNLRMISGMSFAVGIFVLITAWSLKDSEAPFLDEFNYYLIAMGILNLLLGFLNFSYNYKMHLWVKEHSSWEERFAHKSSSKHQLQYLLMWILLIGASFGIACLVYC